MQRHTKRKHIPNNLKSIRESQRLTQEALARKCGNISLRYLQMIEAGTSIPSIEIALIIADALNVPVEVVFPVENWMEARKDKQANNETKIY